MTDIEARISPAEATPERTPEQLWHIIDQGTETFASVVYAAGDHPDVSDAQWDERVERANKALAQVNLATQEACARFNLVPDPKIGDPKPKLEERQRYVSAWMDEVAPYALGILHR